MSIGLFEALIILVIVFSMFILPAAVVLAVVWILRREKNGPTDSGPDQP
jgi:hypothetical protein